MFSVEWQQREQHVNIKQQRFEELQYTCELTRAPAWRCASYT